VLETPGISLGITGSKAPALPLPAGPSANGLQVNC
jgi:hypothetical protein